MDRLYAKRRGLTDKQAMAYGVVCGGVEIAFAELPLDQLLGIKDADAIESLIKKAFAKSGIEASRSLCSSIATILYDCIKHSDQAQFQKQIQKYISDGCSNPEAKKKASENLLSDTLTSATTAFVMELIKTLLDNS